MGVFKAASGREVKPGEDGSVLFGAANGFLSREAAFDAEEWFQAKRDADLGRWRWSENPTYIVKEGKPNGDFGNGRTVHVFNEETFERFHFNERVMSANGGAPAAHQAARAFFSAHPAHHPWHDAQPGEFWLVEHMGMVEVCQVVKGRFEGRDGTLGSRVSMPVTHSSITVAVRMVAEVAS